MFASSLNKYQQITKINTEISTYFIPGSCTRHYSSNRGQIRSKKSRTIGNILSPNTNTSLPHNTWLQQYGCYKHSINRCKTCKYLTQTNEFTSYVTKKTFPIKQYINCSTFHVIYIISCMQYVGCTTRKLGGCMTQVLFRISSWTDVLTFSCKIC